MENCVVFYVVLTTAFAAWLAILILLIIMTEDHLQPLKIELE